MAELSERSGLPVPTIKFYLREGLLPPGVSVGATRARYDESHVQRLRLIRALVDVAQLRLDIVRSVLAGVDRARSGYEAIGIAHLRLSAAPGPEQAPSAASLHAVEALLTRTGWTLAPESPHRVALARALDTIASLGHPAGDDLLDAYAEAMGKAAGVELNQLDVDDRESAVEHAIIGTLLLEPVLLTVRRIAQVNVSRSRLVGD